MENMSVVVVHLLLIIVVAYSSTVVGSVALATDFVLLQLLSALKLQLSRLEY